MTASELLELADSIPDAVDVFRELRRAGRGDAAKARAIDYHMRRIERALRTLAENSDAPAS